VETEAGRRLLRGLPSQGTGLVALNVEALSKAIEAIEAEAAAAEKAHDSLDAAWAEAEAALPDGWIGPSLGPELAIKRSGWVWRAFSWDRATPRGVLIEGHGPTPAAALRALAAKLREMAG
jgi:hypothetical protein